MIHASPSLAFLRHPMRDLSPPPSHPFAAKQPLPVDGMGDLHQHSGHAGLSALVGSRSPYMKFPNGRHSFTGQHPNGELLSEDLARHGSEPAMCHDKYPPLGRELGGDTAHNL